MHASKKKAGSSRWYTLNRTRRSAKGIANMTKRRASVLDRSAKTSEAGESIL
jgi:hypothetical protein